MVSKEVAKASHEKQQKANEEAKAKQDSIIASSKQSMNDNRGYNYSDTSGSRPHGNDPNTGEWSIDPETGIIEGTVPENVRNEAITKAQNIQNRIREERETQKQYENKLKSEQSNLRPELVGSKQTMYDNRGYDYSDTTGEILHGADPKSATPDNPKGQWYYDPQSGESFGKVPDKIKTEIKERFDQSDFSKVDNSPLRDVPLSEGFTQTEKIPVDKSFGKTTEEIEFENMLIQNRNDIIDRNNKVSTDYWIAEGKKLGFKEVKLTTKEGSQKVSIDDAKVYDFENIIEMSFVNTPEMIESNKQIRKEQKEFVEFGKQAGYKEIKIKSKDKTEIIPIDQGYRALVSASPDSEITFVNTPEKRAEMMQIRKEQKEFVSFGKQAGYKEIKIKNKDGTEIVPIDQGYLALVKAKPDSEISFVNTPEIRERNKAIRNEQKEYVKFLKEQGYDQIQVSSKEGGIVVSNVDQGYRNIVANAGVDSTISGVESPSRKEKSIPKDKFSQILYGLEQHVEKQKDNPVKYFFGTALVEVGSQVANLRNLFKKSTRITEENGTVKVTATNKPDWYGGPPSVPQNVLSSPISAVSEVYNENQNATKNNLEITPTENFASFKQKTDKGFSDVYLLAQKQDVVKTGGQTFGFLLTVVPNQIAKLSPVKVTRTPYYTSEGTKNLVTTVRVGYDDATLLVGGRYSQTGKFFIGSQKPQYSGIEKISGPSGKSSFDTFEFADYSKRQIQDIRPSIEYAEQTGLIKKGDFQSALDKAQTQQKIVENKRMFEYEKNVSSKQLEKDFEGVKGKESYDTLSAQQKNKNLELEKGSGIINKLVGAIKTKRHDLDFTADTNELGQKASDELFKIGAKKGYTLRQSGTNISVGKIDKSKPFWNLLPFIDESKGIFIRGDAKKYVTQFVKNPDPSNLPRGELFLSNKSSIAQRFSKRNAEKVNSKESYLSSEIDMDKILQFKKISKSKRKELASEKWYEFQENMKNEAIRQGKLGYTKPYHSLDPKSPKYEIVIFDQGAIKSNRLIKPTSYGIVKGTERDFINIVTPKDDKVSLLGINTDRFYGNKVKTGIVKQRIDNTKKIIKSQDFPQQIIDWGRSSSGVISENTLRGYRGDSSQFVKLFDEAKVRLGFPVPHRIVKDLTREYFWGLRESARFAWKVGDKNLAKEIGNVMNVQFKKYDPIVNFRKSIKELRYDEGDYVIKPQGNFDKFKSSISSFGRSAGSPSVKLVFVPKSNYENSVNKSKGSKLKSVFSKKSTGSFKIGSNKSFKFDSTKSVSSRSNSARSTSSKSASSRFSSSKSSSTRSTSSSYSSAKSLSSKSFSITIPKSFSKGSKSQSTKSPKSPSVKSPKSPSSKSPSVFSPKSPSVTSPKVPPSLKIKNPPTRKIILPLLFWGKGNKTYKDKSKHTITFRWSVKNPFFKKFSINEGKKRKLEW